MEFFVLLSECAITKNILYSRHVDVRDVRPVVQRFARLCLPSPPPSHTGGPASAYQFPMQNLKHITILVICLDLYFHSIILSVRYL